MSSISQKANDSGRKKLVLTDFSGRGGISQYIFCLSDALARAGADLTLLTTSDFELESQAPIFRYKKIFYPHRRQRSFVAKGLVYGASLLRLLAYLRDHPTALLHAHETKVPFVEKNLLRYLKSKKICLILTAHDVLHPEWQNASTDLYEFYKSFDRIIVHAEENRQTLHKAFNLDGEKIRIIPHGEYVSLALNRLDAAEARRRLGLSPESKIVLFFGYIRHYKGLKILLEAFAEAQKKISNLFLIIAGELKENFQIYDDLIARLQLAEHIHQELRYIPMERVPIYFSAADLVALPYLRVYQSGVVQLAYAFKRPVIATSVGGLPEVVEDQRTGFLVPPNSSTRFAQAMLEAFSDMRRLATMGEYAYETAPHKYSWERIAEKTLAIYNEVLANHETHAVPKWQQLTST